MKQNNDRELIRELTIVLIIKVIILYGIWHCFFDNPSTVDTPEQISQRMLSHVE